LAHKPNKERGTT